MFHDNTLRQCSRCGMELTDPASRESGVGPICRKKDNALFAKQISANFAGATMCVLSVQAASLPEECRVRFEAMKMTLCRRAERATRANEDAMVLNLKGEDLRGVIRELDWLLSYRLTPLAKDLLVKTVRCLGYVGLSAVLSGKASTSEAELSFDNGRVVLRGLGCTDGFRAMVKIPGIEKPRYRGDRRPYTAAASQAQAFIANASEFWPCFKGDAVEIQAQADRWIVDHPVLTVPVSSTPVAAVPVGPAGNIAVRQTEFTVALARWTAGAWTVIAGIKALPNKDRKYNPVTKAWTVKVGHLDAVRNILTANGYVPSIKVG